LDPGRQAAPLLLSKGANFGIARDIIGDLRRAPQFRSCWAQGPDRSRDRRNLRELLGQLDEAISVQALRESGAKLIMARENAIQRLVKIFHRIHHFRSRDGSRRGGSPTLASENA